MDDEADLVVFNDNHDYFVTMLITCMLSTLDMLDGGPIDEHLKFWFELNGQPICDGYLDEMVN